MRRPTERVTNRPIASTSTLSRQVPTSTFNRAEKMSVAERAQMKCFKCGKLDVLPPNAKIFNGPAKETYRHYASTR
jgi:hypothetical protein